MIKAICGNSAMYIASLQALARAASMEAALYDGDQEISYQQAEAMLNSQTQTMSASEALKTMSAFLNGGGSSAAD